MTIEKFLQRKTPVNYWSFTSCLGRMQFVISSGNGALIMYLGANKSNYVAIDDVVANFDHVGVRINIKINNTNFAFMITLHSHRYKVRPVYIPYKSLRQSPRASLTLLEDAQGIFIWVATKDEPKTLEQACELAVDWAEAMMRPNFPHHWSRDEINF